MIVLADNVNRIGASGHLSIILFAPGSHFDRAIISRADECALVAFNASRGVASASAHAGTTLVNLKQVARGNRCRMSSFSPSNGSLSYG